MSTFPYICVLLTISLREVGGRVQVSSAHVVAVPLGADPSLLGPVVAVARRHRCCGRGPVRGDGCVLVHNAAERPAGAGVLRRRSERGKHKRGMDAR